MGAAHNDSYATPPMMGRHTTAAAAARAERAADSKLDRPIVLEVPLVWIVESFDEELEVALHLAVEYLEVWRAVQRPNCPWASMQKISPTQTVLAAPARPNRGVAGDLAVIHGPFSDYLRSRGFAEFTIVQYSRQLVYLATWLRTQRWHGRITKLTRLTFDRLLHDLEAERTHETVLSYRKPLRHWLRFQGRLAKATRPAPWQPWLHDYLEFLRTHRGVGQSTLEHNQRDVGAYLRWQFGHNPVDWSAVRPHDLLELAERFTRGVRPNYAADRLNRARGFLAFVHLRGACAADLAAAVPKVAQFHHQKKPVTLSERQCHQLLASFTRSKPEGKRDYAATRCMLDRGLRGAEVIALRLRDVDWRHRRLDVPPVKTGHGRQLPIPEPVLGALRDYVQHARPSAASCDNLFVRHPRLTGQPLTRCLLKGMVSRAYRRCGFPKSWSGTHRLRHTFATRMHRRGADMKPLADLLGHRRISSTNHYTHVNLEALRPLAQPWPN